MATAAVGLIVIRRPDLRIRTATSAVADALCAKIFVSHLDPESSFAEIMDRPGIRRLRFGMRYQLDRATRQLDVSVAGLFATHTIFREGFGRIRVLGGKEPYLLKADIVALKTPKAPPLLPEIAGPETVAPSDPALEVRARSRLRGAGGTAAAPDQGRRRGARWPHHRRAVCARHRHRHPVAGLFHDQINDQRIARHHDPARPRLAVAAGANSGMARLADDPRREIEVGHLMRMTSGLALDETDDPRNTSDSAGP